MDVKLKTRMEAHGRRELDLQRNVITIFYTSHKLFNSIETATNLIKFIEQLNNKEIKILIQYESIDLMSTYLTKQMSAKKGLKMFGEKRADTILKELQQLLSRKVMHDRKPQSLSNFQKRAAF